MLMIKNLDSRFESHLKLSYSRNMTAAVGSISIALIFFLAHTDFILYLQPNPLSIDQSTNQPTNQPTK